MDQYYYVDANNQRQGPVYPTDFARLGVTGETLVWRNGMENWAKASTLPELATWISAPEPPQPPRPEPAGAGAYGQSAGGAYEQPVGGGYGQSVGGASQTYRPGGVPEIMPDNYLVLAVLSTLICLPFGIVSIIKSTQVERLWLSGDRMGAHKASDDARKWALIGIGVSFVAGILYFIIMLVLTATPFLFINKWLYELFSLFS